LDSPLKFIPLRRALFYNKNNVQKEDFKVLYLLVALMSRGAHVKDQLMVEEDHHSKFIQRLLSVYTNQSYKRSREVNPKLQLLTSLFLVNARVSGTFVEHRR
jgi:hypothetical protein